VVNLSVTPHTLTIGEGSAASFSVTGTLADSTTVQPSVTWSATGGVIDANGKFTAGAVPGNFTVSATASSGVSDTAAVVITETVPAPLQVTLSPTSSALPAGGSERFVATGTSSNGSTVAVGARYSATGGTISPDGLYQAGQTPGTFKVVATDTVTSLSDTASVIIQPPPATLQAIVLTPSSASLTAGATQQFTATGKMSDGTTAAVTVSWSASGGSISSGGLYTAGQVAGSFRVIAQDPAGGLADTAVVSISVPVSTSPPPSGGKTFFLADAESGTMIPPWPSWGVVGVNGAILPTNSDVLPKNGLRSFKYEVPNAGSDDHKSMTMTNQPQLSMGTPSGHFGTGYYSFWAYIDAGYSDVGSTHGPWNMLFGWMTGVTGAPDPISHIGLEYWDGTLQLVYVLKNASTSSRYYDPPNIAGYAMSNGWYRMTASSPAGIKAFPRNQWVHVCVYYKMAKTSGQVTIWQDGTKVMDLTAPTMDTFTGWTLDVGHNTAGDMLLQMGIYGSANTTGQRLYLDDIKVTDYRVTP
jgi:hypothetical protein